MIAFRGIHVSLQKINGNDKKHERIFANIA